MATQDDDSAAPSPDPDAPATPAELAQARRFGELVEKTLSGPPPPAMSADDRALLEVATVIRATRGNVELAPGRQRAIVEDALRQAIGDAPASSGAQAPIARPAGRRWVPWLVAGASAAVAAAAILTLWLRAPGAGGQGGVLAERMPAGSPAALPAEWTSRPADALVGPIARPHAGDASARIDAIFADRLAGYRARRWAGGEKP
jgi:hypothetical protein